MERPLYIIEKIEIISRKYKKNKQCEIIMLKIEQPTNIKPDSWYEEYINLYDHLVYSDDLELIQDNEPSLKQRIEVLKNIDNKIIIYNKIDQYLEPILEKERRLDEKIKSLRNDDNYLQNEEYLKTFEVSKKAFEEYYKIPPGISEADFKEYHLIVRGKVMRDSDLLFNCNSLEKNKGLLEILKYRINSIKLQPDINKLESYVPENEERCVLFTKAKLELCEKALNENYLVTATLEDILSDIREEEYNDYCEKKRKHPKTVSDLYFRGFFFTEDQIFDLIKRNEKWHDIDRDITIYQEKKKGKYLQELADNFGIKFNSISMVITKVQGAVNFWKGKLFEDFIYKMLQQSGLFEKVVKEAGKGEADILAYTKDDNELYIYSLKNIKINRKPYWLIIKEELRPELERAVLQSLDYKVHLILLVFDNYNNNVKQFKIDYNNPENIDISK